MKKLISVVLVLVLCLSVASALAAKSPVNPQPSAETETATKTEPAPELKLDSKSAVAIALIEALNGSASVDEFFGDVITTDGKTAKLSELLGSDNLDVNEFVSISLEGTTTDAMKVAFTVPSQYADGTDVIIVIGIVDGEEVTWYAIKGEVAGNQVIVELAPELLQAMLDKDCVVAIVSVAQ